MSTWVRVGIAAALAACSSRTPTERERALERIPAQAQVIFAADGPALAAAPFRRAMDSLSPHIPPSLICVSDAARTSEAVAGGINEAGTTIVLITRAVVGTCPALSRIGEHMYVATIGAGTLATRRADSVLTASTWVRARPYLLREPLAVAAELPQLRVVAVAQPAPLDGWLAIDAADPTALEASIRSVVDRWKSMADKLALTRTGTQVRVEGHNLEEGELVTIVTDVARATDAPAAPPPSPFPPQIKVASLSAFVRELAGTRSEPVIGAADVIGMRLLDAPSSVLQRGDVILGIEGHRITDPGQLAGLADRLGHRASLAVRRGEIEAVIAVSE